jgi:hypothetical protein
VLLQAGVLSVVLCLSIVTTVFVRWFESSFAILGLSVCLCELQMCLQVCGVIE